MNLFEADLLQIFETIIRGFISLVTLFLVTKLMGKKQMSELSLFDYVMGVSIGNFVAEITINTLIVNTTIALFTAPLVMFL